MEDQGQGSGRLRQWLMVGLAGAVGTVLSIALYFPFGH